MSKPEAPAPHDDDAPPPEAHGEERLRRLAHLAAAGQRAAAAVHDLRNPLGVIETSSFILAQLAENPATVDREKLRKHAKRISEQVTRASALLSEVLDAARENPAQLDTVAVQALVDGALLSWRGGAQCEVLVELPASLPAVRTDVARVARLAGNLLDNARDALAQSQHSAPQIYVRARATDDRTRVVLMVLDDGPGLPAHVRARLFEPLVSTKGASGTGLGLASARAIARSLGAELTARNAAATDAPARGAVFELTLPAAKDSP